MIAAYVVMAACGVVGSILAAALLVVTLMARGVALKDIESRLQGDLMYGILLGSPFQLAMLLVAVAWRDSDRTPVRQRLGLVSPVLSPSDWVWLLAACGIPFAASIAAASIVPGMQGASSVVDLWSTITPLGAAAWVLYIGVVPGVSEEMFFRGAIQRRLLRVKSPAAAIGVTSVLFAILHVDPPAMALALILGVWLGWVALKTGSIYPTIACHLFVNSSWNLANIVLRQSQLPEKVIIAGIAVLGVFSLIGFVKTVRLLNARTCSPASRSS